MRYKHEDYTLRRAIRQMLAARGMTRTELSRKSGVCRSSLGNFLACRGDLTGGQIDALSGVLGMVYVDPLGDPE